MPTQNRRIATYLPPHIHEPFKVFKSQRDIKGDSEALIAILSEYLQVSQEVAYPSSSNLLQRIEAIEEKLGSLKGELLSELKSDLQPQKLNNEKSESRSSLQIELLADDSLKSTDRKIELLNEPEVSQIAPMSGHALSVRLGVNKNSAFKTRKRYQNNPQHFEKWSKSKDPDGIAWEYYEDDKLYHPVQNTSVEAGEGKTSKVIAIVQ
jgi:hypothetical protein